jgi:hypothetical protein
VALLAERRIEAVLDDGIDAITVRQARSLRRTCELAFALGMRSLRLEVQYARAYGFWCLANPKLLAIWFLRRYLGLVRAGLARDPRQPYLHYCLGQFYQRAPRLLGGDGRRALVELESAYQTAASYGLEQAKFAVSYASALADHDRPDEAFAVIRRHFTGSVAPGLSGRLANRRARALAVLERIGARTVVQPQTLRSKS